MSNRKNYSGNGIFWKQHTRSDGKVYKRYYVQYYWNGKRVTVTRRLYPGYVLVNMDLNERTMHTVNNIQGVIKFVGSGKSPQPLHEEEINKILGIEVEKADDEAHEEIPFHVGQVVEVTQGPFSDFSGTIKEVYPEKGKVKVEVSLFGRPTSVELDYTQLKGF